MNYLRFALGLVVFVLLIPLTLSSQESVRVLKAMTNPATLDGTPDSLGKEIVNFSEKTSGELKNGVLSIPFASEPNRERSYFDYRAPLDLSMYSTFYVDFDSEDKNIPQSVSLYFHCGTGWYSMSGTFIRTSLPLKKIYRFELHSANREQNPLGLDQVDTIRFGFWRGNAVDTSVKMGSLRGSDSDLVLLVPGKNASSESQRLSSDFAKVVRNGGISLSPLSEDRLTSDSLKGVATVVIAIKGEMTQQTIDILGNYMDAGGFVIACYALPNELMKKMGFGPGQYVLMSSVNEKLDRVEFLPDFRNLWGPLFPTAMKQRSHNITCAVPLEKFEDTYFNSEENRPRIAAWWYNDQNEKTPYPAMLYSGRGIYFSHIFQNEDSENKQKFLFCVLSQKDHRLYGRVLRSKWRDLFEVGMAPGADLTQVRENMAIHVARELKILRWNPEEAAQIIANIPQSLVDTNKVNGVADSAMRLLGDLDLIREKLSKQYCENLEAPKKETRFFWEHSGLGAYHGDWDRTMKELSEAGFNGILPNMCWGGSACYQSEVLPVDPRVEQYGDQIEQAVRAGRKYGVEVHVWKVNFNCSRTSKEFADQIVRERRNQKSFSGEDDGKIWLCPSHPTNQKLEIDAMVEMAVKYDVDGVHFDYIRYPDDRYCYCNGCRNRFSAWLLAKNGGKVVNWPEDTRKVEFAADFEQWRCDQVTTVVRGVHEQVKKLKPSVLISAAVFSGYPGTRKTVGQDWGYWVEKGWLDFVCPMDYTDNPEVFDGYVSKQMNYRGNIPLYPGIGLTVPRRLRPDELAVQIEVTRKHQTGGFILFDLNESVAKQYLPLFKELKMRAKPTPTHR